MADGLPVAGSSSFVVVVVPDPDPAVPVVVAAVPPVVVVPCGGNLDDVGVVLAVATAAVIPRLGVAIMFILCLLLPLPPAPPKPDCSNAGDLAENITLLEKVLKHSK